MKAPHTIVVGLDCADPLISVFDEACLLARTFGAKLILAHAVPLLAPSGEDVTKLRMEEILADMRHRPTAEGLEFGGPCVRFGDPVEVLTGVAKEKNANWIVLGAAQKSRIDAWLLGSVAEKLLRSSPLPVWLVRPTEPLKDLDRIVVAADDSEAGHEALQGAAFLARSFVATLTLLTVGEPSATERALSKLQAAVDLHGIQSEVVRREGEVSDAIVSELQARPADLLVLGCAGRKGLARLWRKNTAEELVRRAPCSVLSLRPTPNR